jgi:hypothetical protein
VSDFKASRPRRYQKLVSLILRCSASCRHMRESCRVAQSLLTPGIIMLKNGQMGHVAIDAQINGDATEPLVASSGRADGADPRGRASP